ncbi:hypothetical protein AAFG13_38280 [Bradyrhizobium sp. B124]|uniref:hypothetical protein n=1 Tax=Bradyrhizobium sp. B124 TaxID=3140245 RepID=UPI00318343E7
MNLQIGGSCRRSICGEQGRGHAASFEGRENLLVVYICEKARGALPARSHDHACVARFLGQLVASIRLRRRARTVDGHRRAGVGQVFVREAKLTWHVPTTKAIKCDYLWGLKSKSANSRL